MDTKSEPIGMAGIVALALSDRIHHVDTRHAAEHTAGEYVGHVLEELGSVGQKDSRAEEIQKM